MRDSLSTTEAARIMGVSRSTLIGWFDQGILPGARVNSARRVSRTGLVQFCRDRGFREAADTAEALGSGGVCVIGGSSTLRRVAGVLPGVRLHTNWAEGISDLVKNRPVGVVLDLSMGKHFVEHIASFIRKSRNRPTIVAVTYGDDLAPFWDLELPHPFTVTAVKTAIQSCKRLW